MKIEEEKNQYFLSQESRREGGHSLKDMSPKIIFICIDALSKNQ